MFFFCLYDSQDTCIEFVLQVLFVFSFLWFFRSKIFYGIWFFIFTPKIEEQNEKKIISLLVFLNCLLYLYFWQRKCRNGGIEIMETVNPCKVQESLSLEFSKEIILNISKKLSRKGILIKIICCYGTKTYNL